MDTTKTVIHQEAQILALLMAKCMHEASQHLNECWEHVLRVLGQFCRACLAKVFLVVDLSLPAPPS